MSTPSPQPLLTGLRRIFTAETAQSALDALVDLSTSLVGAPVVAALNDHSALLYSPTQPLRQQNTSQMLDYALSWLNLGGQSATNGSAPAEPLLCLPIAIHGVQLGVLCIAADAARLNGHTADVDTMILAFTQSIQRLRQQFEAQVLADLSARLGATRDPSALLQQLLEQINRTFGATSRIFFRDERAGNLMVFGTAAERLTGLLRLPLAGSIAGYAMRHDRAVICSGVGPEGHPVSEQETGVAEGHVLCAPLRYAGRAFGALMLVNPASALAFSQDDMRFLTTIANVVAVLVANARLYIRAVRDALTGAYNRGAFNSALEQSWRRAQRYGGGFALILLDLDDFKRINDRFGHSIGDQVLQSVTRIIWETLRSADLSFRYGGEEFCVLLADVTDGRVAMAIAERLRAALDCTLLVSGVVQVQISASVGVAVHPLHGATSPRKLLDLADDAAYQAKRDGKNRVAMAQMPTALIGAPLAD